MGLGATRLGAAVTTGRGRVVGGGGGGGGGGVVVGGGGGGGGVTVGAGAITRARSRGRAVGRLPQAVPATAPTATRTSRMRRCPPTWSCPSERAGQRSPASAASSS